MSEAVLETIKTYLHALKSNDPKLFEKAFDPESKIIHVGMSDGASKPSTLKEFIGQVNAMHAENRVVEELHETAMVHVSGPVASVHVPFILKLGANEVKGTDIFALAHKAGQWRIINKVYSA